MVLFKNKQDDDIGDRERLPRVSIKTRYKHRSMLSILKIRLTNAARIK